MMGWERRWGQVHVLLLLVLLLPLLLLPLLLLLVLRRPRVVVEGAWVEQRRQGRLASSWALAMNGLTM